jgi:hypothetical protein
LKGILVILKHFEWKNHSLYEKYPLHMKREKHVSSGTIQCVLEIGVSCTLFSYENSGNCGKEYSRPLRDFKCEEIHLAKNSSIHVKEEALYVLEENHPCYKKKGLENCFTVRIELVLERNTACESEFSRVRSVHFVPNRPIQLN